MECAYQSLRQQVATLVTCMFFLALTSFAREVAGTVVTSCSHKARPVRLKFPQWEGHLFVIQYLPICNVAMAFISLGLTCQPWFAIGISLLLLVPILFLCVSTRCLRSNVRRENLAFIRLVNLNIDMVKISAYGICESAWTFGKMAVNLNERGLWKHDPASKSESWAFFWDEYLGEYCILAGWKLVKCIAYSSVMTLTDRKINAFFAIFIQALDSFLTLRIQPHNERDANLVETSGACFHLLIVVCLSLPVLMPENNTISFLEARVAIALAMLSMSIGIVMTIAPQIYWLVKTAVHLNNVVHFVDVLVEGISVTFSRTKQNLKKQLCLKYVRELQKEEMTVRLQLILHEDWHTFCVRKKIPAATKVGAFAGRFCLSAPMYESNVVYVQQAIALLAEVQLQDVKLELTSGMPHAVFCRQQSRASSPLSRSSVPYESHVSVSNQSRGCLSSSNNLQVAFGSNFGSGSEHIKSNTVEEMHTLQDVTREHEKICNPATVGDDSQESTIYIDILVNLRSRGGACQAIKNLAEERIDKSLKLHGIHQYFHVISPATSQLDFALGSKPLFYLHPLPLSASAVLLQAKTRRMLIKRGTSSLSARFRPGNYEDKEDSNNSIHSEHKSKDRLPRESWVDLRSEFKMREALEKHYRFSRNLFHSRTPSGSSENSENKVR